MIASTSPSVTPADLAAVNWRKSSRSQGASANCVEVGTIPWRTSSRGQGAGGNCVEVGPVPWRKSSRSQGADANCVELGPVGGERVAVRDSKDRDGGVFVFGAAEWTAFLASVRAGTLDHA